MVTVGNKLLSGTAPANRKFGFHYPPFNSVMHLHLHCFELPHKWWLRHKYSVTEGAWAGYMTAEQLLDRLRSASESKTHSDLNYNSEFLK